MLKKTPQTPQKKMGEPLAEPKFGMVELFLGSFFCLLLDLLSAITAIAFVGLFVKSFSWLIFTFWFKIKKCHVADSLIGRFLVPVFVNLIPIVPTLAATFLVSAYMENHPEKFAAVEQLTPATANVPIKK
ncbi:MAG: hypothetical protein WCO21_01830 [bacterium]